MDNNQPNNKNEVLQIQKNENEKKFKWTFGKVALTGFTVVFASLLVYDYSLISKIEKTVLNANQELESQDMKFNNDIYPILNQIKNKSHFEKDDFDKILLQASGQSLENKLLIYVTAFNLIMSHIIVPEENQAGELIQFTEEDIGNLKSFYNQVISDLEKETANVNSNVNEEDLRIKDDEMVSKMFDDLSFPIFRISKTKVLAEDYDKYLKYQKSSENIKYWNSILHNMLPIKSILDNENPLNKINEIQQEYKKRKDDGTINNTELLGFNEETWNKVYAEKFGEEIEDWFKYSMPKVVKQHFSNNFTDENSIKNDLNKVKLK